MLWSYLCGNVRIQVRIIIKIHGFFFLCPLPKSLPPWPRTILRLSLNFIQNFSMHVLMDLLCVFFAISVLLYIETLLSLKKSIYIYKIMHFARFDFLITMSKLAWLYYKIFLYPYILHYLCEIFCCEILKNIPLPLKFLYQKKISWVNIYWMWLHVDDSFKIKKKKK